MNENFTYCDFPQKLIAKHYLLKVLLKLWKDFMIILIPLKLDCVIISIVELFRIVGNGHDQDLERQ